ncbi:MAG: guanylate kinase [Lachnospiraceae bacterium]|nr:guanylate kinase [Lachnospiraceae bacterium]
MGRIICLMGKSSTGKDTIYKRLLADPELALRNIVPYTTRPIRDKEQDGVEYFFTDEAGYRRLQAQGKVIEARAYETCYGLWRYFTVADERIDLSAADYCMIGTLEAYLSIRDYFGEAQVLPVLIELDDGERLSRALTRERAQLHPKYEEMCRRFLADSRDFAPERIREAGIDRSFCNEELEKCLEEIRTYIRQSGGDKS